ncbi:MAG: sigma 54-interacting transcriptional regulator [Planctomycetota bacterium]
MTESTRGFDDRVSFPFAESVLAVLRERAAGFEDETAVWESFIRWRGKADEEYVKRIRDGRQYIFYSLLQELFDFAEEKCGENVAWAVGERLAAEMLRRHVPDLLQATLAMEGPLLEKVLWLAGQFLEGGTVKNYPVRIQADPGGDEIRLLVTFLPAEEVPGYLERAGHNPSRAFANSFHLVGGTLSWLLGRAVFGYDPKHLETRLQSVEGEFILSMPEEARFHYESIIELLLDDVHRLRERVKPPLEPAVEEAALCASSAMNAAWNRIRKASRAEETVLLGGESGTGKSYYARMIHLMSPRREGPFVEVGLTSDVGSENMIQSNLFGHTKGAFTGAQDEKQGLFALADGGTIFLDEIGDASPELQAKLLRVLEQKNFKKLGGLQDIAVDVRILAATNRDLEKRVEEGTFREDLFYRLNVIRIDIPPLHERDEDLAPLIRRLFERVRLDGKRPELRLSAEAFRRLCARPWPGNVRQLENALRHAVAFCETEEVVVEDLPPETSGAAKGATAPIAGSGARPVVNAEGLSRALDRGAPPAEIPSFEWEGHIDHARRVYLKTLIEHHGGKLEAIGRHWDRSSENTLLKTIREFGLEGALKEARKRAKESS